MVKLKDMTTEELIEFGVKEYGLNKEGLEALDAKRLFEIISDAHKFMTE